MNTKRLMAALLALLLACVTAPALAVGKVTPETPANPDIRISFGAWVENALVPYLQEEPQDKWSAKRCHAIAGMVEAAGFPIADKWKDALYRTKRERRLTAETALSYLICSQYGEYWEWTVEDKAWFHQVAVAAGMRTEALYSVPGASDGSTSQILAAAHDAICSQYDVTDEQWRAYDINADFVRGRATGVWMLAVMPEWGGLTADFSYYCTPSTGDVKIDDLRKLQ